MRDFSTSVEMTKKAVPCLHDVFFIVGPTATGKSDLAADVAHEVGAELVNADAFQIYEGFTILSAKPDEKTLRKARHHLIGAIPVSEEMNAGKFRREALRTFEEIRSRQKPIIVVGGSGLYVKALTHGLEGNWKEVEVDLAGVVVLRDRDELYARINRRVEEMLETGAIEEVRQAGPMSSTASKMIGVREIQQVLDEKMSILQGVAKIQQNTRQYAKRQLTWFRHQTNFEPLNISLLSHSEAVKWISERARRAFAKQG
jgi:tRNA A37 N6-isopentenylltransferase MiaA